MKKLLLSQAITTSQGTAYGIDSDTVLAVPGVGDEGDSGHEVTVNGTPVIASESPIAYGTAENPNSVFGSCAYFNVTDAYLSVPDHADWDFSSDNFVIDFWFYNKTPASNSSPSTYNALFSTRSGASDGWVFAENYAGNDNVHYYGGAGSFTDMGFEIPNDKWSHVAFVKSSTTIYAYLDGVQKYSNSFSGDFDNDSNALIIGNYIPGSDDQFIEGYFDEIRISKGTDRGWTGSTITVPTSPYTSDSNTKLLFHFSDLNQGETPATITDSGNTGHTVTNVSSKVSGCSYWWTGSMQFDGSTDYLSIPDSSNWDIIGSDSDNWTIGLWVNHSDITTNQETYISQLEDANNFWRLEKLDSTGYIRFFAQTEGTTIHNFSSSTAITYGWHYVTLCKVGSTWGIYIDGIQVGYASDNSTDTYSGVLSIGAQNTPNNYFEGYIDDVIIQKSNIFSAAPVSGLTDTITVPTSPQVPDSNTVLYLPLNGDMAEGHTTPHQITVANTGLVLSQETVSSLFKPSLSFGGSTYLTVPDSVDWDIAGSTSQDYTIDFYIKHVNTTGVQRYLAQYEDSSNFWLLDNFTDGKIRFLVNSGGSQVVYLASDVSIISDTNWHHVTLCKVTSAGPTVEYGIYFDGTQIAYVSDTSTDTFSSDMNIGNATTGGASILNGYMTNIRIQKSNWFNASPNSGKTDTITIPNKAYSI